MGGAQHTNRKHKQSQTSAAASRRRQSGGTATKPKQSSAAAAKAVAAARGSTRDITKIITGVVVIVVIAAAVVVGVLYEHHKSDAVAQTVLPAKTVSGSAQYPATLDKANATVLVGKPTAKITVDAYEDFLCPICGNFETQNFPNIAKQLQAGTVQVRYHMINLLDNSSVPAGYSMMAANTALAVATVAPDKFMDYHYSLYQKQPEENGAGWTQAQLTSLANRLGVNSAQFTSLVNGKTYDKQIQANLNAAENDKAIFQTSSQGTSFGTPTIVVNRKVINWQADTGWLNTLVKNAYPS